MPQLIVNIKDKIARTANTSIVCGNTDYTIKFEFDEEWDAEPVKTARFIWNGQYQDTVFNGDTCGVPMVTATNHLSVGVYAGDLRTTTPAIFACSRSILCEEGNPVEPVEPQPSGDVYKQILDLLNAQAIVIENKVDKVEGKGLSTEDFTTEEKEKLATLENYDDSSIKNNLKGIINNIGDIEAEIDDIQTDVSSNTNDIANLKGEDNRLLSNITALNQLITDVEADVKSNATDITALKATTSNLSDNLFNVSKTSSTANQTATAANNKADIALARNEFTDEEKSKLAGITNPMVIKGRVDTVADLPTIAQVGWFYFVGTEGSSSYMEYCYSQSGSWEYIGATTTGVDLSNYYTKSQIDEKISGVTNDVTGLDIRLTQEEDKVFKLGQDIATNTSNIETNTKDITAIKLANQQTEGTVNGIREDVELNKTNITTNSTAINNANSEIEALQRNVGALTELANTLDENVETNTTNISTLGSRVTTLENNEVDLSNYYTRTQVDAKCSTLEGLIDTTVDLVDANTADISTLKTKVANNTSNISDLQYDASVYELTLGYRSKNLFKNTTTSQTINGITFTVNSDGTVTANGTATATVNLQLKPNLYIQDKNWVGNIFSTGIIASNKSYRGVITYYNSSWASQSTVYLNSTEHVLQDYPYATAGIYIQKGTTVNNIVFEPMIRRSFDTNSTYEPYGGEDVNTRLNDLLERVKALEA